MTTAEVPAKCDTPISPSGLVRTRFSRKWEEKTLGIRDREYPANAYSIVWESSDCMIDANDRSARFELIAMCDGDVLVRIANRVLASDPPLSVLQEPKPQLLMQQVREPVEHGPFNLGEVVVTPAEIELAGERGFAMVPGKAERAALSGAIVDAAVAAGHERTDEMTEELETAIERHGAERTREWSESRHTAVEFETMEDEL